MTKLGRPVRRPQGFRTTRVQLVGDYLYKFDDSLQVCDVVPIGPKAERSRQSYSFKLTKSGKKAPKLKFGNWRQVLIRVSIGAAVAAFMLLAYPFYPQLRFEFERLVALQKFDAGAAVSAPISTENRLRIPKVGIDTAIVEGLALDVLDREEGVWHQTGSLAGNFVLAGHRFRYLPPNTSTFYNLDKLEVGDLIVVDWFENRYTYAVLDKATVNEKRIDVIAPTEQARLTLYTCSDRAERDRIVVTAELVPR